MTLLDWLIVFVFLAVFVFGHVAWTPLALLALVLVIVLSRILRGERL